jgi:hypothetical protein
MKVIESYKHCCAKEVLMTWFPNYVCEAEKKFYINGKIVFVPDVTLLDNNIVVAIYEIEHRHGMTGKKLGMIQSWQYRNYPFAIIEIGAERILNQVEKPLTIQYEIML